MSLKDAILTAYEKGYRVTDDGILIGMKGKPLRMACSGNQFYPTFSVSGVKSVNNKYGVFGIPVHKFAAYCFYGSESFDAECVRHLNGNVLDVSMDNIALGTRSENELDKDPEVRRAVAKKARAAQGHRPSNAKFSDAEVRYIRQSAKNGQELAEQFGVTRQAIYLIRKKKNYGNI